MVSCVETSFFGATRFVVKAAVFVVRATSFEGKAAVFELKAAMFVATARRSQGKATRFVSKQTRFEPKAAAFRVEASRFEAGVDSVCHLANQENRFSNEKSLDSFSRCGAHSAPPAHHWSRVTRHFLEYRDSQSDPLPLVARTSSGLL